VKGSIDELCVDSEGRGAVKRETNMNPNQSLVLLTCTLLLYKLCVHDAG
jgi:hypothetical protein